jgi:thiol-disulfide isomerase/thioredoxin
MLTQSPMIRRALLALAFVLATGLFVQSRAADDKKGSKKADGKSVEDIAKEGYWGEPDNSEKHAKVVGKPMPKLELTNWVDEKKKVEPADMKGKIVVVDFWATWCGPCLASIPHNNKVAKEYADKGVILVGSCGSERGKENMPQVAKEHKIEYPTAEVSTESTKAWAVQWWPTYAIVDRKGVVRAIGIKPDYVEKVLDALLEEQPAGKKETASAR